MKYLRTNPFPLSNCIGKLDVFFFYLPLMCGKKEWTCWRKGACDFQVTAFWFWKKTAKLCNSVNAKRTRTYKHLGKGGDPGHVLWLWMMQFFSASRNSLSFRWWLAAEVSGREKTNTALHSTSPKPARIQKNLVSVGCVSSCGSDGDRLTLPDHGNYTFSLSVIKPELFLSDSKMECLQLTMTEVLKRLNSKSKKGYNQVRETWLHSVRVVCGFWAREQKHFDLCKTFSNSKTSATKTILV